MDNIVIYTIYYKINAIIIKNVIISAYLKVELCENNLN